MHSYQVGALYAPGRTSWPEAGEYNYRAGAHELRLFYSRLKETDIKAITRRPCEFGVLSVGPALFFLYKFSDDSQWSDAPYSWHMVRAAQPEEETEPPALQENERVLLSIVLVAAETGIIAGLRMVSLSINVSRALHAAIRAQIAEPFDQSVYEQTLADVYRRQTSDQLALLAERCRIV